MWSALTYIFLSHYSSHIYSDYQRYKADKLQEQRDKQKVRAVDKFEVSNRKMLEIYMDGY